MEKPICPKAEVINEVAFKNRSHTYVNPECPEDCMGPIVRRMDGILGLVYPHDFVQRTCANPNITKEVVDIDIF